MTENVLKSVLSYGGGVNSVALCVGMIERDMPPPIAILFSDTGGERTEIYDHMAYFSDYLVAHGYPPVTMLRRVRKDGSWRSLEDECLEEGRLPAIAYGFKTCSQKFKVEPQDKFLNNLPEAKAEWKAGRKIEKLIGFDYGEAGRARFYEQKKYVNRYLLIEWKWRRAECLEAPRRHGIRLASKSACFFCPQSKLPDILALPPDLASRALAIEEGAQLTKLKGLGRRFAWKDVLAGQAVPVSQDTHMPCGCYDEAAE